MKNYEVLVFDREKFTRPIVYIFYDNETPLYVGYSKSGIGRPFYYQHHQREAFERATHIEVRIFESDSSARAEEKRLIAELSPPFNGRGGIRSNGKHEKFHSHSVTLDAVRPSVAVSHQEEVIQREFRLRKT